MALTTSKSILLSDDTLKILDNEKGSIKARNGSIAWSLQENFTIPADLIGDFNIINQGDSAEFVENSTIYIKKLHSDKTIVAVIKWS